MNVASLVRKAARTHGHRVALRHAGEDITYRELDARTGRLAAGLRGLGLAPQDRVVLWAPNRPELIEMLIACWKANLTPVPVNVRLHPAEVDHIVANSRARLLAHDGSLSAGVATMPPAPGVVRLRIGREPSGPSEYDRIAGGPDSLMEDADDEDLAWLFYTSGTTGRPKGAMLTHRNLLGMTMSCLADICSFEPEDVVLHAAPLTHGSGLYLLPAVARGSLNLISHHPSFDPGRIAELIARHRVTVIAFLAPTMISRLIDDPGVRSHDLSSLRCVPYGGGPMYVEHLRAAIDLLGPIWVQLYGQGETPMTGTYLRAQEHRYDSPEALRRLGSAGIPRTDIELRILDERGDELPHDEVGEIVLRGATVMKGYWDNPAATEETLRDGWLHTGDLGFMDTGGYVYIVDRGKDMIISGGNNIYARELEEVLLTHPGILEVAVIGVPDPEWGESVHAVVAPRPGVTVTADEVVEHCRARLAAYKKPRSVEFVDALPKSAYGKVLKRELRERHWEGYERRVGGGRRAVDEQSRR